MEHVYLLYENSDKTEGRGPDVLVSIHETEEEAYNANKEIYGAMGVPKQYAGTIYRVGVGDDLRVIAKTKIFGYRKDWAGRWGYGWLDNRDAPTNDPEYDEYLRLKNKFEGVRNAS